MLTNFEDYCEKNESACMKRRDGRAALLERACAR